MLLIAMVAIGYTIGLEIVDFRRDGAFDSWKILESPKKWGKIVEATSQTIWVQAVDNSIYEGCVHYYRNSDCIQWRQVEEVPTEWVRTGQASLERKDDCSFGDFVYLKQVPGESIECVRAQFRAPTNESIIYYALLKDGTIYYWWHASSPMMDRITLGYSILAIIVIYAIGHMLFKLRSRNAPEASKRYNTG
jgi:hypothetical protein